MNGILSNLYHSKLQDIRTLNFKNTEIKKKLENPEDKHRKRSFCYPSNYLTIELSKTDILDNFVVLINRVFLDFRSLIL